MTRYVPQDARPWQRTVREVLQWANRQADEPAMWSALEEAGLVQTTNPPPASAHSNPLDGTLELNVNIAVEELEASAGPVAIVVSGAVVSTVTLRVPDGLDTFPATSVARAVYVCTPSATPVKVIAQAPVASAPVVPDEVPPSDTRTLLPGSAVPPRVTVAPVVVSAGGSVITGAAGAVRSTVQS